MDLRRWLGFIFLFCVFFASSQVAASAETFLAADLLPIQANQHWNYESEGVDLESIRTESPLANVIRFIANDELTVDIQGTLTNGIEAQSFFYDGYSIALQTPLTVLGHTIETNTTSTDMTPISVIIFYGEASITYTVGEVESAQAANGVQFKNTVKIQYQITTSVPALGSFEELNFEVWLAPDIGVIKGHAIDGDESIALKSGLTRYASGNKRGELLETSTDEFYFFVYYDESQSRAWKKMRKDGSYQKLEYWNDTLVVKNLKEYDMNDNLLSEQSYDENGNPVDDELPGDANGDSAVDLQDFSIIKANFGSQNATLAQGDLNGDSLVDLADFNILKSNFGQQGAIENLDALNAKHQILDTQSPASEMLSPVTPSLLPNK